MVYANYGLNKNRQHINYQRAISPIKRLRRSPSKSPKKPWQSNTLGKKPNNPKKTVVRKIGQKLGVLKQNNTPSKKIKNWSNAQHVKPFFPTLAYKYNPASRKLNKSKKKETVNTSLKGKMKAATLSQQNNLLQQALKQRGMYIPANVYKNSLYFRK